MSSIFAHPCACPSHPLPRPIPKILLSACPLFVLGDRYGWLHARTLVALIPRAVSTVGVITSPSQNRPERSSSACTCAAMVSRLVSRIRELRPDIADRIRLRGQDTPLGAWARLVLAPRAAICLTSAFCMWPTIASTGRGFVVEPPTWPRAAALASLSLRKMDEEAHPFVEEASLYAAALWPWVRRLPNLTVLTGGLGTFKFHSHMYPARGRDHDHDEGGGSALSRLLPEPNSVCTDVIRLPWASSRAVCTSHTLFECAALTFQRALCLHCARVLRLIADCTVP